MAEQLFGDVLPEFGRMIALCELSHFRAALLSPGLEVFGHDGKPGLKFLMFPDFMADFISRAGQIGIMRAIRHHAEKGIF